jgi:NAD(P)-dependent dehydrogenase (short-subunit alcohol dehydrogenase family)
MSCRSLVTLFLREMFTHFEGHLPWVCILFVPICSDFFHFLFKVNNVGTNIRKPTTEYSAEDYSFLMATNLESAYHLCQLAHPLLKASGLGSIVFVSSVCGLVAVSSGTLYAMTKGNYCSSLPACDFDFLSIYYDFSDIYYA